MKKSIFSFGLLAVGVSSLFSSSLICQKGWIGKSFYNYDLNSLSAQNGVDVVWYWNNKSQSWLSYKDGFSLYGESDYVFIDSEKRALIWVKSDGSCLRVDGDNNNYVPPLIPVIDKENNPPISQSLITYETFFPNQKDVAIADFTVGASYDLVELKPSIKEKYSNIYNLKIWKKEGENKTLIKSSINLYDSILIPKEFGNEPVRYIITADSINYELLKTNLNKPFKGYFNAKIIDSYGNIVKTNPIDFSHNIELGKTPPVISVEKMHFDEPYLGDKHYDSIFKVIIENNSYLKIKDISFVVTDEKYHPISKVDQINNIAIYNSDNLVGSNIAISTKNIFENININIDRDNQLYVGVQNSKSYDGAKEKYFIVVNYIVFENTITGAEFKKSIYLDYYDVDTNEEDEISDI